MIIKRLLLTAALLAGAAPAAAQAPLTVERIWGSSEFASDLVVVEWLDEAHYVTTVPSGDLVDLYRVSADDGEPTGCAPHTLLAG